MVSTRVLAPSAAGREQSTHRRGRIFTSNWLQSWDGIERKQGNVAAANGRVHWAAWGTLAPRGGEAAPQNARQLLGGG